MIEKPMHSKIYLFFLQFKKMSYTENINNYLKINN